MFEWFIIFNQRVYLKKHDYKKSGGASFTDLNNTLVVGEKLSDNFVTVQFIQQLHW